ncbi:MAG: methionyl-tRNA formyltransferase [Clostridia bacterium]|nr:methionyl-tRNA formyltransferase [Clostridia bacterium]
MKIVFAGTPQFAVSSLKELHKAGFDIAAVLTQPDRPQGRKGILTPPPVKEAAMELNIPVIQPEKLKADYSVLADIGADLMVTCAYGQILTQEILDLFPKGVWNVHASLLPAYRGAAPIARAIIDGETETGVTIMKTDAGLDTGDMLLSAKTEISPLDTYDTLMGRLAFLGAKLIVEALQKIEAGNIELKKQGDGFVCKKVVRTQVDFSKSAEEVSRLIRGLASSPLAFGTVEGLTLNFYHAEAQEYSGDELFGTVLVSDAKGGFVVKCGEGAVRITEIQPAGGKVMSDKDFCNGRKVKVGQRFDQPVL